MKIYMAPMEGITTWNYRKTYEKHFGKIDRYFTPFISNKKMGKRDLDGILPRNNPGKELIPQIMSNKAEDFLAICDELSSYGYRIVNLNLGCPSGTVVNKKRGSGFLAYPRELERFLEEIFNYSKLKISIKSRIGVEKEEEWEEILSVYERFPLEELIIHPRLRSDFYKNEIRITSFEKAYERMKFPLCYNGELNSVKDVKEIMEKFPKIERIMIGRGILRYPNLVDEIRRWESKTEVSEDDRNDFKYVKFKNFHDELYQGYREIMSGDKNTLFKMKEFWFYFGESFQGIDKSLKQIRKAETLKKYEEAVDSIFM